MGVIPYAEPLEEKTAQKTARALNRNAPWGSPAVFTEKQKESATGETVSGSLEAFSMSSDW